MASPGPERTVEQGSFRQQVKGLLRPGSSVLLVAVRRVTRETVLATVSQYGGKPLTCPLAAGPTAGLWP